MLTLGLDNALQVTGWSIYDDLTLYTFGTFTTKNTSPIEERLKQYWDKLNDLYSRYKFEYLYFEDCQKQQNAQTYQKLSMVKAVILLWCGVHDMPYTILVPSHWRSILKDNFNVNFGKNRTEQKSAAKAFVKEKFYTTTTEDEADSICLHLAGLVEKERGQSAF